MFIIHLFLRKNKKEKEDWAKGRHAKKEDTGNTFILHAIIYINSLRLWQSLGPSQTNDRARPGKNGIRSKNGIQISMNRA